MDGARHTRGIAWAVCGCVALLVLIGPVPTSWGYTPDSPEVRAMIEKACKYLETATDRRLGGKALVGLVFVKEHYPPSHPRIAEAVAACREAAQLPPDELYTQHGIYSMGLALMFLVEAGHETYRPEIDRLIKALEEVQRPEGGWGYPPGQGHDDTGDTSMTQYAVLGLWTAHSKGIPVPAESVRKVAMWLIRTQDPGGGWGYQGHDPGGDGSRRIKQTEVRHSMVAAGLGSVYVCADLMGVAPAALQAARPTEKPDFPSALKPVGEERDRAPVVSAGNLAGFMARAIADGNKWYDENYTIDPPQYQVYHAYGLERYKSFQELLNKEKIAEPQWYNDGVEYFAKLQQPNGLWAGDGLSPNASVDTAFATLFLMRSTRRSIEAALNYGDGRLAGGRGLPKDLANARIKQGKIVAEPLSASPEEVMAMLEDPENSQFDKLADNPESVLLQMNLGSEKAQLERLRRVIQGGSFEARRVAVQALATRRNLDNVPVLIYALSDPDPRVVVEARDALRFISRKFDGFGLPESPTFEEQQAAIFAWKEWYRSIKPDAEFLD